MPCFDLLKEPWIPVRDKQGGLREVGLLQAILHAHRFRRIEDPSPLVEVALHRLLLAVLHRALQGPRDEEDALALWQSGRFPETPVRAYLERYHDRFDLFDETTPFYQVPDLPVDDPMPWSKLLPELASGHNPTLFDHTTDDRLTPATPALAARALLVHQTFAPGGLIRRLGVTSGSGAPLATAAVFIPLGATLFETLVFNLAPYDPTGDLPIWEREPYRTRDIEGHRTEVSLWGRTRVYTWLTRAVRLIPEPDGTVQGVGYGPGVVPVQDRLYLDAMCAYTWTDADAPRAVRLAEDRAFWRDFEALLPEEGQGAAREKQRRSAPPLVLEHARNLRRRSGQVAFLVPLAVLGQIADQAKVLTVRREVYPFPLAALEFEVASLVRAALEFAKSTGAELRSAGWILARALLSPGGREPLRDEVTRLVDSLPLMPHYWSRLERAFVDFLETIAREPSESVLTGWVDQLRTAVREAWDHTVRAVGVGARHLRAIEAAQQRVAAVLGGLKQEVAA